MTVPVTRREDKLAALIAEATPLPWMLGERTVVDAPGPTRITSKGDYDFSRSGGHQVAMTFGGGSNPHCHEDAALIVAAANALPAALDIIRAARDLLDLLDFLFKGTEDHANEPAIAELRAAFAVWDNETT